MKVVRGVGLGAMVLGLWAVPGTGQAEEVTCQAAGTNEFGTATAELCTNGLDGCGPLQRAFATAVVTTAAVDGSTPVFSWSVPSVGTPGPAYFGLPSVCAPEVVDLPDEPPAISTPDVPNPDPTVEIAPPEPDLGVEISS